MTNLRETHLLEYIQLRSVPAGTAIIGLEQTLAEKFIRSYGPEWDNFYRRETPQHSVDIAAFELAQYPVTNGFYALFMADGGYDNPAVWTPDGWAWRLQTRRTQPTYWGQPRFSGDAVPVVGVTWYEAMAVARWAAIKTGRNLHLPTEVEWEWAARGENAKWLYPWGGIWDAGKLNSGYHDDKHIPHGKPIPVGMYSPAGDGPFGHSDLLGQTWEWTNSAYKLYPYDAGDGREDPYAPERRVLKGGNWGEGKYSNRITGRYNYPPNYADTTIGFRLAADGTLAPMAERPDVDLVVYGRSTFCPDLVKLLTWLRAWNVPYRQVQIDLDESVAFRLDHWLGSRTVPTLVIARHGDVDPILPPNEANLSALRDTDRGSMLHEPDESTLRAFLTRHGILK